MLLKEALNPSLPQYTLLTGSKIWERDVESLRWIDMRALYVRLHQVELHDSEQVKATLYSLREEIRTLAQRGLVDCHIGVLGFTLEDQKPLLSCQLVEWLWQMSIPRRRLVLFSLSTGYPLERCIDLDWPVALRLIRSGMLTGFPAELVQAQPRHFQFPIVFWEQGSVGPVPLVGVRKEMERIADMGWDTLAGKYQTMTFVERTPPEEIQRLLR